MRTAFALRSRSPLIASLAHLGFLRLWSATGLSMFGDMLTTTGLSLVAYSTQHSILAVGAVFAVRSLPSLVLGPLAGQLTDMLDRRRLMVSMDLVRACLVLGLPWIIHLGLVPILLVTLAVSGCSVLFQPGRNAVVPELLPEDLLHGGNSAMAFIERTAEVLGYGAAGAIILAFSTTFLFIADGLTYLASALLLVGLRVAQPGAGEPVSAKRVADDIRDGFRAIAGSPAVRSILGFSFLMVLFGACTTPLTVQLAIDHLHAGGGAFALLEGAMAAGATAGAVVIGSRQVSRRGRAIGMGMIGMGLSYIAMGLAGNFGLALAAFVASGFVNMAYLVPLRTAIQVASAGPYRGRIIAAWLAAVQCAVLLGVGLGTWASSTQPASQVGRLFILSGVIVVGVGIAAQRSKALMNA